MKNKGKKTKSTKNKYGQSFTIEELREHFRSLIGEPKNLSRKEILEQLKGTQFDEFAFD